MDNKDTMKRFIGGLMIGGLLLGGGGFALASTTDTGAGTATNAATSIGGPRVPGMKGLNSDLMLSVFDSMVSAGTINQTQADQIIAKEKDLVAEHESMKEKMNSMKETIKNMTQAERDAYREQNKPARADAFTQLVNDGIITQAQAVSIRAAFEEKMAAQRQENLSTALNGLVEKNVINSDQSTAILNKLTENQSARQAQMDATKDMTKEQRQAYFEANKPEQVNPLAELVTAGTITQAQADEIAKVIPFGGGKGMGMHQGRGNGAGGFGNCGQGNSAKTK